MWLQFSGIAAVTSLLPVVLLVSGGCCALLHAIACDLPCVSHLQLSGLDSARWMVCCVAQCWAAAALVTPKSRTCVECFHEDGGGGDRSGGGGAASRGGACEPRFTNGDGDADLTTVGDLALLWTLLARQYFYAGGECAVDASARRQHAPVTHDCCVRAQATPCDTAV
jgi:hypothetical protein